MDLALMGFCWINWSGNSSGTWSRPFRGLLSVGGAPLPTQLKLLDVIGPVAVLPFSCVERRPPRSFWLTKTAQMGPMQSLNFHTSPYGPYTDSVLLDELVREQLRDVVQALQRSALGRWSSTAHPVGAPGRNWPRSRSALFLCRTAPTT